MFHTSLVSNGSAREYLEKGRKLTDQTIKVTKSIACQVEVDLVDRRSDGDFLEMICPLISLDGSSDDWLDSTLNTLFAEACSMRSTIQWATEALISNIEEDSMEACKEFSVRAQSLADMAVVIMCYVNNGGDWSISPAA